jgi:hypothetical protein
MTKRMKVLARKLDRFWALEEIRARQRSRDRNILEGDRNTAYFHALANHRARKKKIAGLEGPSGFVQDNQGILKIAADFYKNLLKGESRGPFCLDRKFWDVAKFVLHSENADIEAPFSEEEVQEAVFSSYADGALGPDGLPFLFYHKFWEVIKRDLMNMFEDLYEGRLDLFRINLAVLTLIP